VAALLLLRVAALLLLRVAALRLQPLLPLKDLE
jgi:hypothetical protein